LNEAVAWQRTRRVEIRKFGLLELAPAFRRQLAAVKSRRAQLLPSTQNVMDCFTQSKLCSPKLKQAQARSTEGVPHRDQKYGEPHKPFAAHFHEHCNNGQDNPYARS
jgi:hypothetical protein